MKSVIEFLEKQMETELGEDAEVMPDPECFLVYLVMDHTNKNAFLVYLPGSMTGGKTGDFEQCDDFEDCVTKYSSSRNWRSTYE